MPQIHINNEVLIGGTVGAISVGTMTISHIVPLFQKSDSTTTGTDKGGNLLPDWNPQKEEPTMSSFFVVSKEDIMNKFKSSSFDKLIYYLDDISLIEKIKTALSNTSAVQ